MSFSAPVLESGSRRHYAVNYRLIAIMSGVAALLALAGVLQIASRLEAMETSHLHEVEEPKRAYSESLEAKKMTEMTVAHRQEALRAAETLRLVQENATNHADSAADSSPTQAALHCDNALCRGCLTQAGECRLEENGALQQGCEENGGEWCRHLSADDCQDGCSPNGALADKAHPRLSRLLHAADIGIMLKEACVAGYCRAYEADGPPTEGGYLHERCNQDHQDHSYAIQVTLSMEPTVLVTA